MAVNWNAIYGINKSDAQVWQGNRGLEYLEQQDIAEQKRRQKEDAELANELGKINYDGAKPEDLPALLEVYNGIKQKSLAHSQAKTDAERIQLAHDTLAEKAKLSQMTAISKQNGQLDAEYAKLPLTKPDEIADGYVEMYKTFRGKSSFDPERTTLGENILKNGLRPKFDELKFIKEIAPLSVDKVQSEQKERTTSFGKQSYVTEGESFNPKTLTKLITRQAAEDRGLREHIKKLYPDMKVTEATLAYSNQLASELAPQYIVKDRVTGSKNNPDPRRSGDGDGDNDYSGNVQIVPKTFYTKGQYNSTTGQRDGVKPAAEFAKFATTNPVAITTAQIDNLYDVGTGKNIRSKAIEGAKVTGVGWGLTSSGEYQLRASIVDKDSKEYILRMKDVPLKAKEDKYMKSIISSLGNPPERKPKAGANPTKAKSYTSQQEALIKKNLSANPKYSREEIIEALGL